jgi:hypothetical protein
MTYGNESDKQPPAVTIILPTYNRAKFLAQAFESIRSQRYTNWELIVVDDGSTDNTRELVEELTCGWCQPVHYHFQENQGAYGARNTGLDLAQGQYIAFFDSDDVWLPHHLEDCVSSLRQNPDVDWVYGATQIVDFDSGRVLSANCFYINNGQPRPFMRLRHRKAGPLHIIKDSGAIECMILNGMYCGLQCSVIRRRIFETYRFNAVTRNEAEDQLIVVHALARGVSRSIRPQRNGADQFVVVETLTQGGCLGYLNNIHVVYHVHEQNSSAAGTFLSLDRHLRVFHALANGYEQLGARLPLTTSQRRALKLRLSRIYFWDLGYVLLHCPGRQREALAQFHRGMRWFPWKPSYWKTYLWARLRIATGFGLARPRVPASH